MRPLAGKWARQLADGLKGQFDEESIWQTTRSEYLFMREVERGRIQP